MGAVCAYWVVIRIPGGYNIEGLTLSCKLSLSKNPLSRRLGVENRIRTGFEQSY